jgi:bifunctional non-homologous end joining protein LigD
MITLRVNNRTVPLTRPGKVLFPADGFTKQDLVAYYARIARVMLPHLRDRPLALERYPDGITALRIFQKDASRYFPDWIRTAVVPKVGGTVRHVVCNDTATLVYLATQACITPHVWLSRVDRRDAPDQMVWDLDPAGQDFEPVRHAARALKRILDDLELPAYLKSTGSRGLHVVVPLARRETFEQVRAFARVVADAMVRQAPAAWTVEQLKRKRGERLFIDVNRNGYAQTMAPAFAVRARPGAPVAVPLHWHELDDPGLRPDGVTMHTVFERLERVADPWDDFQDRRVGLARARDRLEAAFTRDAAPRSDAARTTRGRAAPPRRARRAPRRGASPRAR